LSTPVANDRACRGKSRLGSVIVLAALAGLLSACVTNGADRDRSASIPSWRSIGIQEAWLRVDDALAASQRSTPEAHQQRIVLRNDTLVSAENRIDLETSRRRVGARNVVEIEEVADRAASLFGSIRADRLQQENTAYGPLFYIGATPRSGTACVFAFQRLSPGAGSLPASARPIVMSGQNCVPGSDPRLALDPFTNLSVRPASIVLNPAS
jgi:hypothetical protein